MEQKKVVSPFEFAIMEIADPEEAKKCRPETDLERAKRREEKFQDFCKKTNITHILLKHPLSE